MIPFLTNFEDNPDFTEEDCRQEFESMRRRNRAINSLLDGTISAEDLLDILEVEGVNPTEYVNAVEGAVNAILR